MADLTFRITTYWQRAKGEPGVTQIDSMRLSATEALDVILAQLGPDVVTVTSPAPTRILIALDWSKAPTGVLDPRIPGRAR